MGKISKAYNYCCPRCFGDIELEQQIFPSLGAKFGNCDFCGKTDIIVLKPADLIDSFQPLVEIYKQHSEGLSLIELLKRDWALFENSNLNVLSTSKLVDKILCENGISKKKFVLSDKYYSYRSQRWKEFKDEIKYKNRWFLDEAIDLDRLESLLTSLFAKDLPKHWYRARLLKRDTLFKLCEMGAPPKELSTFGRANPAGIPYLYLASKPETALAEVRPHDKEHAAIAKYLVKDIKAVDLRNPRKRISPFIIQDTEKIGILQAELPLLEELGKELTRPVLPLDAAINYTPSQYFCEFIKKKNYDGVIFNSSVSEGYNLALFDTNKAEGLEVNQYSARVNVTTFEPDQI